MSFICVEGGRRIHYALSGGDGPAVVMEVGGGQPGTQDQGWRAFKDALPPNWRLLSYDRAGLGRSDPANSPRSLADYASDLRAIVETLGLLEPIVVVASSVGGAIAVHFASTYRDSIAGLVLLDAFHPSHNLRALLLNNPIQYQGNNALSELMAEWQQELDCVDGATNPDAMDMKRATQEASALWELGSLPLRVFTAGRTSFDCDLPEQFVSAYESTWLDLQRLFVSLSKDSEWQILPGVGHCIHEEAPMRVVNTVMRLIESLVGPSNSPTSR